MERLSILVDGDTVCMEDLPPKILDHVGDVSLLPPVDEDPPAVAAEQPPAAHGEAAAVAGADASAAVAGAATAAASPPDAAAPVAAGGVFVWPNLGVLTEHGLNLKDFLDTIENRLIDEALAKAEGVKNQAAELLGIKRTTLIEKLKKRGS